MNHRVRHPGFASLALAVLCVAVAFPTLGQSSQKKVFTAPRLWDGKTPDLRGIWLAQGTAYVNIEGHAASNGIAASKSIIVDPPNGKIPYKPDALAKREENYKNRATADPSFQCDMAGVPRAGYLPTPVQIAQSPKTLAIIQQENHAYRIVYPSSMPHLDGIDWWMGDSRGHWEGDTLVVDVVSLNGEAWFDQAGNYHSDNMHVVERYTLTGPNTLQYEARIEDPDTFTHPWTIRTVLSRDTRPGAMLIEDECLIEPVTGKRERISPFDPKSVQRYDLQDLLQNDHSKAAAK